MRRTGTEGCTYRIGRCAKFIERLEERLQCRVPEIDAFRVRLHPDTNGAKLSDRVFGLADRLCSIRKGHLRVEVERAGVRAAVRGGLLVHQACKCYGEDLVSGIYVRTRRREREQRARDALPGHEVELRIHRPVGNVAPADGGVDRFVPRPAQNGLRGY